MAYVSQRFGKMKNGSFLPGPTVTNASAPGMEGGTLTPEQEKQQKEDANERAGFIPRVTQNLQDRWSANPGENVGERVGYRWADRAEDFNQGVADRSTRRAGIYDKLGMDNMAELARSRAAGATVKATGMQEGVYDPNAIKDKLNQDVYDFVDDQSRGGYMPYADDVADWQKYLKDFDPNIDPSLKENVVGWNPGQESMFGENSPYAARESSFLSGLEEQGDTGSMIQAGEDFNAFAKTVGQGLGTDLEKSLEQQGLLATQGKLTAADSQWMKNQEALLDQQQADEIKELRKQMGASGGLAGGKFQKKIAEITNKYKTQKNALLSEAQKGAAERAQGFALQNRQNTTQYLNTINDMIKTGQLAKGDSLKTLGGYLTNAAQTDTQRMQQKISEKQLNLETAMKKKQLELERAGMTGDTAKWKNEYDIAQRNNYRDLIADIFGFDKLFETGGNIVNTAIGALAK